ncbi:MAG TPA: hypothetical protein VFV92_16675, partial [Candidatus Bathyarchaeia archaeon]|nr:hypothetical protein [Candidatus Bathyarchaeia archaeon]
PKLLDMALEQLKEEMPEKFSNTRRQNGSPVSGSSETASSGSRSRGPSARDLPAEAKAAGERFVKQGLFKDLNEYAKDYFSL